MIIFMCRDPNHAIAEVWFYFEQYWGLKKADLEAFAVPLAKNMEAIWAVTLLWATFGKLYT